MKTTNLNHPGYGGVQRAEPEHPAAARARMIQRQRSEHSGGERAVLEARARSAIGDGAKFDGLTDRQVREAVLSKLSPNLSLDGRDASAIEARFDGVLSEPDPAAAQQRMRERNANAWKGSAA